MNSQRGFIPLNIAKVFADSMLAKFAIAKKHTTLPPEPKPSGLTSPRKVSTSWHPTECGKQEAERNRFRKSLEGLLPYQRREARQERARISMARKGLPYSEEVLTSHRAKPISFNEPKQSKSFFDDFMKKL